jgi:5-methylcytosine-specific restriction endonuclease McrA
VSPSRPLRPCIVPHCPHLVGRSISCPVHGRHGRTLEQRAAAGHRFYSRAKWRHPVWGLRSQVLRDHPFCSVCASEGRPYVLAEEVDHVVPHRGSEALFFDRNNLGALCKKHHSEKTQRGA